MEYGKDVDFIYNKDGEQIVIELTQQKTRSSIIQQYIACRKRKNITQDELAKATGISRPNISRFESGTYNPTLKTMVKIAAALDMELHISLEEKKNRE